MCASCFLTDPDHVQIYSAYGLPFGVDAVWQPTAIYSINRSGEEVLYNPTPVQFQCILAAKLSALESAIFAAKEHNRSYESFVLLSAYVARLPRQDQEAIIGGLTTNKNVDVSDTLGMLQKWKQSTGI